MASHGAARPTRSHRLLESFPEFSRDAQFSGSSYRRPYVTNRSSGPSWTSAGPGNISSRSAGMDPEPPRGFETISAQIQVPGSPTEAPRVTTAAGVHLPDMARYAAYGRAGKARRLFFGPAARKSSYLT